MNRVRKSPLLWIGIALLGLLALTIVLNIIGHFFTQSTMMYQMHSHIGHGRGGGFNHREIGFGGPFTIFNFSLVPFLVSIGLIVLGWWIWKKADGKAVKKWVGITLLVLGLFSILPLFIAIPVLLITVYFAIKGGKEDSDFIDEPIKVMYPTYTTTTHDILDEWERKTNEKDDK